jgi:hypothetical protein
MTEPLGAKRRKNAKKIPHHGMDEFPHFHHLTKSQVEVRAPYWQQRSDVFSAFK